VSRQGQISRQIGVFWHLVSTLIHAKASYDITADVHRLRNLVRGI